MSANLPDLLFIEAGHGKSRWGRIDTGATAWQETSRIPEGGKNGIFREGTYYETDKRGTKTKVSIRITEKEADLHSIIKEITRNINDTQAGGHALLSRPALSHDEPAYLGWYFIKRQNI